jgi:putative membrane protein
MKTPMIAAALILGAAATQFASAQTSAALNKTDTSRLVAIAQANIAEVEAGKLAVEKSSNADVKQFAQTMIDDHGKGLEETKKVADAKKVSLPTEPDAAHKKMAADLKKLSGAAFDKAYVSKAGVADHTKVLAALKDDIANASDADVKALASKLEPTVAHHKDMAEKLNAAVK